MRRYIPHLNFRRLYYPSIIILIPLLTTLIYFSVFQGRIYPNIYVAGIELGGLSQEEALKTLGGEITTPEKLRLSNDSQNFEISATDVGFSYDLKDTVERAYNLTRTGNIVYDSLHRLKLLIRPSSFGITTKFDEDKLSKYISIVSGQDSIEAIDPKISLISGKVKVEKGSPGTEVDQKELRARIGANFSLLKFETIKIPVKQIDNTLSEVEVENAKKFAESFIGKRLVVSFEYINITFNDSDLIKFLNPKGGYDDRVVNKTVNIVAEKIQRPPQNPKFNFENGRVNEFLPAKDGVELKSSEFRDELVKNLEGLRETTEKSLTITPPTNLTPPTLTTDKVNNLGIKELIGRGFSTYYHSIPSRVHNVSLAASKINGTLVAPGETFSFNETLGDVSQFTGYKQAYIISGGKTILGDGGGVCQVSTTLFRALLNSGLPILERTSHAYRVGYYEQNSPPGLDATVYGPTPDLKFTNDTPAYILIEAQADPRRYTLTFELYGTSDGRVASITKPVVTNVTPPPEDLYQDDPTLPMGTVKQVDFKTWGAKVSFSYTVKRDGQEIFNKVYVSNYRPWQAVYLRGTGPVN